MRGANKLEQLSHSVHLLKTQYQGWTTTKCVDRVVIQLLVFVRDGVSYNIFAMSFSSLTMDLLIHCAAWVAHFQHELPSRVHGEIDQRLVFHCEAVALELLTHSFIVFECVRLQHQHTQLN